MKLVLPLKSRCTYRVLSGETDLNICQAPALLRRVLTGGKDQAQLFWVPEGCHYTLALIEEIGSGANRQCEVLLLELVVNKLRFIIG